MRNRFCLGMLFGLAAVLACASLVRAQESANPPGLLFSTVLNGVKMEEDMLRMQEMQAVFLPEAKYGPELAGKIQTVIRKKDGTKLDMATWYADKQRDVFWTLSSYKREGGEGANIKLAGDGDYILDFYLNGKLFYRFPFKVVSVASDDPLSPGKTWHLEGAWNDWGYLNYLDADPSQTPMFKLWMTRKGKPSSKVITVKAAVVRESDGKVVCRNTSLKVAPRNVWIRYEMPFVEPEKERTFRTEQLLKEDGKYVVKVTVDDAAYGTYPFAIAGGKIVPHERAQRGKVNPLVFIEGGRGVFWVRRSEAPAEDLDALLKNPPLTLGMAGSEALPARGPTELVRLLLPGGAR